eukprot:scaffold383_cov317-Prasinococcus_capsulatus_cf.AAC.5
MKLALGRRAESETLASSAGRLPACWPRLERHGYIDKRRGGCLWAPYGCCSVRPWVALRVLAAGCRLPPYCS